MVQEFNRKTPTGDYVKTVYDPEVHSPKEILLEGFYAFNMSNNADIQESLANVIYWSISDYSSIRTAENFEDIYDLVLLLRGYDPNDDSVAFIIDFNDNSVKYYSKEELDDALADESIELVDAESFVNDYIPQSAIELLPEGMNIRVSAIVS